MPWHYLAASVRGPAHRRDMAPNQDSWLVRRARCHVVAAACDGLGSHSHSAHGARAGCLAVADAARVWLGAGCSAPDKLLRAIHALWNIRVEPLGARDKSATCLFCVGAPDGRLVLGQLGDGLVLLVRPAGASVALEPTGDRFANETTGLGIARSVEEWRVHVEPLASPGTLVMLATDGVAGDLLTDQRAQFARFLAERDGPLPAKARARALGKCLRQWPVPGHRDDKTVAILWNQAETEAP